MVCGDLPTDYVSADEIKHPRDALASFAERWQEVADYMSRGQSHPTIRIGSGEHAEELAPLLEARAELLHRFAADDSYWGSEYD